jgi:REP element-mobilizing transposase RayT
MPRQLRIEYPGAIYHVTNPANSKRNTFATDVDRRDFLTTLAETCAKTGFQVHAYCLTRNHYHLVVETPNANLVAGMHWLMSVYTMHFNARHHRSGPIFSGRYKTVVVDGSGSGYLRTACDYVHLNPVWAKLIRPGQPLLKYPWSSFGSYLVGPSNRPSWLRVDRLLKEYGIGSDRVAGRRKIEHQLEARRTEAEDGPEWKGIRRGWCLGTKTFKESRLERMADQLAKQQAGEPKRTSAERQGKQIIAEELKRLGWETRELRKRRKGDPAKLAIAARLRRETTLTLSWIAARLHGGTCKSFNAMLHRWRKEHESQKINSRR